MGWKKKSGEEHVRSVEKKPLTNTDWKKLDFLQFAGENPGRILKMVGKILDKFRPEFFP